MLWAQKSSDVDNLQSTRSNLQKASKFTIRSAAVNKMPKFNRALHWNNTINELGHSNSYCWAKSRMRRQLWLMHKTEEAHLGYVWDLSLWQLTAVSYAPLGASWNYFAKSILASVCTWLVTHEDVLLSTLTQQVDEAETKQTRRRIRKKLSLHGSITSS